VLTLAKMRALLVLLAIGLLVYSVIDCSRTPEQEVPGGIPRSAWLVLVIVVPILGPLLWIFASRSDQSSAGGGNRRPRGPRPGGGGSARRPTRPMGPDDDPDFLRGI
jgi:ABC-type transport system involved in cytochrome c biogenesis permease component